MLVCHYLPVLTETKTSTMTLHIGSGRAAVTSFEEASKRYLASVKGKTMHTAKDGILNHGDKRLTISFNGVIWDGKTRVYDPRSPEVLRMIGLSPVA